MDKIEVQALEAEKTFTRVAMVEFVVGNAKNKSTKPATILSKKRGRLSLGVETFNYTRLIERSLTEILAEPVRKVKGKKGQPTSTTCIGKRSRGI